MSDPDILGPALSAAFLEHQALLPLELTEGVLVVGTWQERVDSAALDDLCLAFEARPRLVRVDEEEARTAIARLYSADTLTAQGVIAEISAPAGIAGSDTLAVDDLRSLANEPLVVRLVNLLLIEALEARASDIHLESFAAGLQVRYRIDGLLQQAATPPTHLRAAIVSRLKIMADLDISERRLPQDGRVRLRLQTRNVDIRVSTVPLLHGESIVLRLLDREAAQFELDALGMTSDTLRLLRLAIQRTSGIVLVTGPTGSGKTTTLYAAISELATGREKIVTVEDPVEYELPGVCQTPIHARAGVTFAGTLRALLRQDPDIIFIGEIRDPETAQIATQAALTGHLVLSTLHTNDAPSAITRLLDLGVPDYLIDSTVRFVLAQRLVRRLCATCATPAPLTSPQKRSLPELRGAVPLRSVGCEHCRGTGYRGRAGVYEYLDSAEAECRLTASQLNQLRGDTLRAAALQLVCAGVTTVDEFTRVIGS